MVDRVQVDIKPILQHKVIGKKCKKRDNGSLRLAKKYIVKATIQPQMKGPDLVLTWYWLGKAQRGQPQGRKGRQAKGRVELARKEVSIAASLEIEEVNIQVGGDAEAYEEDELGMSR